VGHLAQPDTYPGTGPGLIVAEGKVFASSVRPNGSVWPENHVSIGAEVKDGKYTAERLEALKRYSAYDADDLTVAIDLATGKTVWTAIEKGRGINRFSGKQNHSMATPAYHSGKVFSLGITGVLYAYDAATGRKLWEDATGILATQMVAVREKLIREKNDMHGGSAMGISLVVADGVLIVPQYDTTLARDIGLRGVNVDSGKTLTTSVTTSERRPAIERRDTVTVPSRGTKTSASHERVSATNGTVGIVI
jgi:outer membrane protein assembly factor BamB